MQLRQDYVCHVPERDRASLLLWEDTVPSFLFSSLSHHPYSSSFCFRFPRFFPFFSAVPVENPNLMFCYVLGIFSALSISYSYTHFFNLSSKLKAVTKDR